MLNTTMAYNWKAASTPQGRERLKELMDGKITLVCRSIDGMHDDECYFLDPEYDISSDDSIGYMHFLDPSPSPEPRPSNDLLWEAFQEAKSVDYLAFGHLVAKQAKEKNREQFEKWIATLPADPLAADKASIQTEFANGLERKLIDAYCTGDAIAAMKRFAGMEVYNE